MVPHRDNARELAQLVPHKKYGRAQCVLVVGRREMGKTTFLREYLATHEPRVLVLDPFGDFRKIREADRETALEDLQRFDAVRRRIVPPVGYSSQDWGDELFREIVDRRIERFTLVLDEITLWAPPTGSKALDILVYQGRHLGLRIVAATQKLGKVPGSFLTEATDLVIFRTTRPRDLDVLGEWVEGDASWARRLPPHQAAYLSV